MAASSSHLPRAGSRALLADDPDELPGGSCNFRNLGLGPRAHVCGCKKFWLNTSHGDGPTGTTNGAWCFCGHHACFHNADTPQQSTTGRSRAMSSKRRSGIEEQDHAIESKENVAIPQIQQPAPSPSKELTGLGIHQDANIEQQQQSIDTRVWQALNEFARNQEDGNGSDAASKLPSTAPPSIAEVERPSPHRVMQDCLQMYRPMGPPVTIPSNTVINPVADDYSATEVATPSIAGTPDFRAMASSSSQARASPGHLRPSRLQPSQVPNRIIEQDVVAPRMVESVPTQPLPHIPVPDHVMSQTDMQSMLRSFAHRLDVVENQSFAHVPVEEMEERFDLIDGRLIDLETWRTEQEQQAQQSPERSPRASGKKRRLLPNETASFDSDGSFDLNAAAHTEAVVLATLAANAETNPRIENLEARVADLEGRAPPSFSRPWQVQVVLLPWGRDLKGIWFSAEQSTQHSVRSVTQMSEEWTMAQSTALSSFNTSVGGGWTTESIEAWANEAHEWLSPKACGPSGMVFQRLESRGLVRDIEFNSSDSRHILHKITEAFGRDRDRGTDRHDHANDYQGLREQYIPLRKVRKSTRLRFLSPAEMTTSATWTADFFDSSVFMKIKEDQRRLYITTPEAYIQPAGVGSSWQSIRELPMYGASGEEQAAQANNIAIEACWTYNDALDYATSFYSSSSSHESRSGGYNSISKAGVEQHSPPSPSSENQLLHRRTLSLPISHVTISTANEVLPKRRIASFETTGGASVPILPRATNLEVSQNAAKRRRVSASPGIERRGVNFTPRRSREPPSPFASELANAEAKSQGAASSSRRRGATPFAYATPHSNSNIVMRLDSLVGDGGDTEADTDMGGVMRNDEHGGAAEDEWQGVDDEGTGMAVMKQGSVEFDVREQTDDDDDEESSDGNMDDDDDEDDDEEEEDDEEGDDEDEGLTIYLT